MTNEQILKKAIEKASKNEKTLIDFFAGDFHIKSFLESDCYYAIIFEHRFAKAFWGVNPIKPIGNYSKKKKWLQANWETHLQQMVLEKEPLKYLEKFLCQPSP